MLTVMTVAFSERFLLKLKTKNSVASTRSFFNELWKKFDNLVGSTNKELSDFTGCLSHTIKYFGGVNYLKMLLYLAMDLAPLEKTIGEEKIKVECNIPAIFAYAKNYGESIIEGKNPQQILDEALEFYRNYLKDNWNYGEVSTSPRKLLEGDDAKSISLKRSNYMKMVTILGYEREGSYTKNKIKKIYKEMVKLNDNYFTLLELGIEFVSRIQVFFNTTIDCYILNKKTITERARNIVFEVAKRKIIKLVIGKIYLGVTIMKLIQNLYKYLKSSKADTTACECGTITGYSLDILSKLNELAFGVDE